jgi:hypothetical protein
MKCDVIMSHFSHSHYTVQALQALGSRRTVHLIDNSFLAEMKGYALINPHIHYLRDQKALAPGPVGGKWNGAGMMWKPLCTAASWNWGLREAETEWVINVNPDVIQWPQALTMLEQLGIDNRPPGVVLIRTQVNFNVWAADRQVLLDLGGFDERFIPCGAEDEDMLVRISQAGHKWTQATIPVTHMDGGHKSRADHLGPHKGPYANQPVFEEKHGWGPHTNEYGEVVSGGRA